MSILLDDTTRVLVQGITGLGGRRHTHSMIEYGTNIVAGVSPGHGGEKVHGVAVFDNCRSAVGATGATASVNFVGGLSLRAATEEAADAGLSLVVCMAENVPLWDIILMKAYCARAGTAIVGPNCNGIVSPGKAKVGFFPAELSLPGPVGIASRSGTLAYGAMTALQAQGLGQSTVVGIGGAPVRGLSFTDCLDLFRSDEATRAVVLLGEIGGSAEEEAAELVAAGYDKPVVALVVGRSAPPEVPMGHAGAIASSGRGSWQSKVDCMRMAGIRVARDIAELADLTRQSLRLAWE